MAEKERAIRNPARSRGDIYCGFTIPTLLVHECRPRVQVSNELGQPCLGEEQGHVSGF